MYARIITLCLIIATTTTITTTTTTTTTIRLKALSGSHAIALAAKYHSVPMIVCSAMYQLSPQYLCSYDHDVFNKFASPQAVLDYAFDCDLSQVEIPNPVYDYVPPELVTLFITNKLATLIDIRCYNQCFNISWKQF